MKLFQDWGKNREQKDEEKRARDILRVAYHFAMIKLRKDVEEEIETNAKAWDQTPDYSLTNRIMNNKIPETSYFSDIINAYLLLNPHVHNILDIDYNTIIYLMEEVKQTNSYDSIPQIIVHRLQRSRKEQRNYIEAQQEIYEIERSYVDYKTEKLLESYFTQRNRPINSEISQYQNLFNYYHYQAKLLFKIISYLYGLIYKKNLSESNFQEIKNIDILIIEAIRIYQSGNTEFKNTDVIANLVIKFILEFGDNRLYGHLKYEFQQILKSYNSAQLVTALRQRAIDELISKGHSFNESMIEAQMRNIQLREA